MEARSPSDEQGLLASFQPDPTSVELSRNAHNVLTLRQ
jgi:hypothetical protein